MPLRTPWLAIAAMFVLNGALFGIWAARVPGVMQQFSLSHASLGLLLLVLAGGAVCSFPLAGKAVDRLGAAKVTRTIAVIYPLTLIVLALAHNILFLSVFLFIFGAAHGAMDVAMNSWGAEVERRAERRFMSGFHAMFSLGAGLGAFSGYLAVQAGLGLFAHFAMASVLISAVTIYAAQIPWQSDVTATKSTTIFAFPKGALLLVGVVAFCASLGEGAMADWSAVYLSDIVQVGEGAAALGYTVFSIAMVVMRLLGDMVVAKLGAVRTAQLGGIIAAAGMMIVVVMPMFSTVLLGFALLGVGYAVVIPLAFSRAANDPHVPPGQAISSVATLGYGGMLLGPPAIGFLASLFGLPIAFGVLALLAAMIVVLARALR